VVWIRAGEESDAFIGKRLWSGLFMSMVCCQGLAGVVTVAFVSSSFFRHWSALSF
jgi:hypothetical protein